MAININTTLTTEAGSPVLAGSMIKVKVGFGNDILNRDEEGVYDGTFEQLMIADLGFLYISKSAYQANPNLTIGQVQEFGSIYTKSMTLTEYNALMADGSLAEQWVVEYLNGILGAGVCTLVDPFTV